MSLVLVVLVRSTSNVTVRSIKIVLIVDTKKVALGRLFYWLKIKANDVDSSGSSANLLSERLLYFIEYSLISIRERVISKCIDSDPLPRLTFFTKGFAIKLMDQKEIKL